MREDEIYEPARSPLAAVPGLNRSAVGWRVIIVRGGPVTAASAVRLVVSARVLAVCSSNPLIPLACVDVSSQDHDGGGR